MLRGPQGTLFGRNATAGAIQFVTRDPTGEAALRQDVTIGNQGQLRTRTTVDTPAIGAFSAYATYVHDESRGDVRNLGAGVTWDRTNPFTKVTKQTSPKWLGGRNYENIFAALKYDGGGDLTLTYKFNWVKGKSTTEARMTPVVNPGDPIGGMLTAIINAQPAGGGIYGPVTINPNDRRPDAVNNAWNTQGFQRVQSHTLTAEFQASDELTFKNIFSYRKNASWAGGSTIAGLSGLEFTQGAVVPYTQFAAGSALAARGLTQTSPGYLEAFQAAYAQILPAMQDSVGQYFAVYEGNNYGRHWQISDELQANYSTENLNVTAGALYYHSSAYDSGLPGFRPNFAFTPVNQGVPLPLGEILKTSGKTTSIAAYAQAEYQITPELEVVAGGRMTWDEKTTEFETGGTLQGDRTTGELVNISVQPPAPFKKSKPSFAVGLNYQPNRDILVYGKYSTAFLSGGAVGAITFPPETVKSWEAGIKTDWFDRRVRFNLTAYSVVYDNAQAATSGTAAGYPELNIVVITNGKLKAKGIEADFTVAPFTGFSFGGTAGYTDAKVVNPDPRLSRGLPFKTSGQPKWVGSLNATYVTQPLFDDATLMIRGDMTFQSKSRVINDPDIETRFPIFAPYEFIPSKQLVNTRIALRDIEIGGASVEIAGWSKNLFNNRKPIYPFQYPNFLMTTSYEQARTYGVDLIIKFNP